MTINISVPATVAQFELKPRIAVIGVGGAGCNAVNNMIDMGLEGVEFIVANSDAQALAHARAERRIQMGTEVTRGLGAGSNPDIGRAAAEESLEEILSHMRDANMVFITAGLGGGTGTGAAPVIARAARDYGILTVGVVTKPFHFEGDRRMKIAEAGLEELQQYVDTLLIIPNQNLFRVANESTTFAQAFKLADDVLYSGVRGVTDLMVMPGLINLDFADIRAVMSEMGKAMMGTGEAEGENRAIEAAEAAIANPLLDDSSMSGAKGVLINITASRDITLFEVDDAANRIRKEVDKDANIIFGSTFDDSLQGKVRVSVVATGIESGAVVRREQPERIRHDAPPSPLRIEAPVPRIAAPQYAAQAPAAHIAQSMPPQYVSEGAAAVAMAPAVQPAPAPQPLNILQEPEPQPAPQPAMAPPAVAAARSSFQLPKGVPLEHIRAPLARAPRVAEPMAEAVPAPKGRDLFIPEPPADAGSAAERRLVNPFAAADMVNAPRPVERPAAKKSDLFARITGLRRTERSSAPPHQTEPTLAPTPRAAPAPQAAPMAAPAPLPPAEPVAESRSESVQPASQAAAPLLGGIEPDDRLPISQDDDDPLDIPAFLRRQAN
jgi:cell division protein FtsZ